MGREQTDQEETEYPHLACCINLHAEDLFKNKVCSFVKMQHMQAGVAAVSVTAQLKLCMIELD